MEPVVRPGIRTKELLHDLTPTTLYTSTFNLPSLSYPLYFVNKINFTNLNVSLYDALVASIKEVCSTTPPKLTIVSLSRNARGEQRGARPNKTKNRTNMNTIKQLRKQNKKLKKKLNALRKEKEKERTPIIPATPTPTKTFVKVSTPPPKPPATQVIFPKSLKSPSKSSPAGTSQSRDFRKPSRFSAPGKFRGPSDRQNFQPSLPKKKGVNSRDHRTDFTRPPVRTRDIHPRKAKEGAEEPGYYKDFKNRKGKTAKNAKK